MRLKHSTPTSFTPAALTIGFLAVVLTGDRGSATVDRTAGAPIFSKEVVDAWTAAGGELGWLRVEAAPFQQFFGKDDHRLGDVPGFRFEGWPEKGLSRLPAPTRAFGLYLAARSIADWQLEDIGKLEYLYALNLMLTGVTDAGIRNLHALKGLRALELSCNEDLDDAAMKELAGLKHLKRLGLNNTKISDAGLAELLELHALEFLDVSETAITNAGLKTIGKMRNLHTLAFSVRAQGTLREVNALRNLRHLFLNGPGVGDAELHDLTGLRKLDHLCLRGASITDAGVKELAAFEILRSVDLSETNISDAALVDLVALKNLMWINLGRTLATEEGRERLQKAMPQCNVIHYE